MTIQRLPFFRPAVLLLLFTLFGALPGCSFLQDKFGSARVGPEARDDLWDRVRGSLQLQAAYGAPEVQARFNWFRRNQGYLHRSTERGSRYLYHILAETERRGMPAEIALLPIVESAFRPFAYSPAHASGIWQFIPATGKRYGLKQNWWYDGRRDIVASTRAALDYLQALEARFHGDWLLAIAAYNTGEGNVERAIRRNREAGKPTDFWSLGLATETRNHVPQLLALASVVEDPHRHGLVLKEIPNRPYFRRVSTGGHITLALAAKSAGISLEELRDLNPAFRHGATDPEGPHHLLLPKDRLDAFRASLAEIPADQRVRWHRHVVKKGESLDTIARWFKTPAPVLRKMNRLSEDTLYLGREILIPTAPRPDYQPDTSVLAKKKRPKRPRVHVVRSGENLSVIAQKHRIPLAKLVAWNGIARDGKLMPGKRLRLHRPDTGASSTKKKRAGKPRVHVVKSGENLSVIAQKYRVSLAKLISWNRIAGNRMVFPGQRLKLYR